MITPPTDSLYKFIAIAGLAMLLWGASFPWIKAYEAELQSSELRAHIKSVSQKADQLRALYETIGLEIEQLRKSPSEDMKYQKLRTEQRDIAIKLIETQLPVDIGIGRIEVIEKANMTFNIIGKVSVACGFIFILVGFLTWYFKVQRYLDRDIQEPKK